MKFGEGDLRPNLGERVSGKSARPDLGDPGSDLAQGGEGFFVIRSKRKRFRPYFLY